MENPFNTINDRLSNIETLLLDIKHLPKKEGDSANPNERLSRKKVKEQYGICYGTIHNLMKNGKLSFSKIGRKTLFKREDLETLFSNKKG